MAETDQDQKTEQPTGKRLGEARDKGQLPISRETSTWVVLLSILAVVAWVLPSMMVQMIGALRGFLEAPHSFALDDNNAQAILYHAIGHVAMVVGLTFMVLMAAVIGGVMIQTGFFFALDLLKVDLERLLPSKGLSRLFSLNAVVDLIKSLLKTGLLGAVAFAVIAPVAVQAPGMAGLPLVGILSYLHGKVVRLITMMLLAFTVIAVGDFFYTRYSYIKGLKMTKTEVKDEFRQMEGDPMIKSRLRQIRVDKARKRMMAQVPKADVVITNPTHYAIALQYDGLKMTAPVVLAKGMNLIALRIREVAEENRVPLVSNPPLARALHDSVEVDQQIPTQHYRAVAEIISYVYKLRKRKF